MRRWRSLLGLSAAERRWLLQALLLLPLAAWAIRWCGLGRLQSALERWTPAAPGCAAAPGRPFDWPQRAARMVEVAAARGPFAANCLHRSVVLWWLLRRSGIQSELRIGIRKQAGALDAHAWIERDGAVLNDRPRVGELYQPFQPAFPAPRPIRS